MCCYAKTMRCHDSHMMSRILCAQKSTRCVPDPFLLLGMGSGDKTNVMQALGTIIMSWLALCTHEWRLMVHVLLVEYYYATRSTEYLLPWACSTIASNWTTNYR